MNLVNLGKYFVLLILFVVYICIDYRLKGLSFLLVGVLCVMYLIVYEEYDVFNFCFFYDLFRIIINYY